MPHTKTQSRDSGTQLHRQSQSACQDAHTWPSVIQSNEVTHPGGDQAILLVTASALLQTPSCLQSLVTSLSLVPLQLFVRDRDTHACQTQPTECGQTHGVLYLHTGAPHSHKQEQGYSHGPDGEPETGEDSGASLGQMSSAGQWCSLQWSVGLVSVSCAQVN